jgi:protocatechuate 3,4-dioxygenase beta subunit
MRTFLLLLLAMAIGAVSAEAVRQYACTPTVECENGPFYKPGAPERESVGNGYLMSGTVRSAASCKALPGARLEIWLSGPDGYEDRYRATLFAKGDGSYRFSSPRPKNYGGKSHIHIRVTAPGYLELYTQHFPGRRSVHGTMDLVLVPDK